MTELLFGTNNPGKITQIQGALRPLAITVRGIGEIGIELDVPEDGATAAENARIKATAYASAAGRPVFSMDNALYLAGLSDSDQPGLHARRLPGSTSRPTDAQMVTYHTG